MHSGRHLKTTISEPIQQKGDCKIKQTSMTRNISEYLFKYNWITKTTAVVSK